MDVYKDRSMTPDKALRWLIEFGTDWVNINGLFNTWADNEIERRKAWADGYLISAHATDGIRKKYKLSDKALKLIEESKNV
jgi:hypothetical protein